MVSLNLKAIWSPNRLARFNQRVQQGLQGAGTEPLVEVMFRQWLDFYSTWTKLRFNRLSRSGGGGEWPPLAASTLYARSRQAVSRASAHYAVGNTVKVNAGKENEREVTVTEKMRDSHMTTARRSASKALQRIFDARTHGTGLERLSQYRRMDARGMAQVAGGAAILVDTGALRTALDLTGEGNIHRRRGPTVEYGIGGGAEHKPAAGQTVREFVTIGQLAAYHQAGGGHLPQRRILVKPLYGDPIYARMARTAKDMLQKLWEAT